MIVTIPIGWKSRKSARVNVYMSLVRVGCIEIDANISLNPMEADMNPILEQSYYGIAKDFGFEHFELDTRDTKTMWIWKRER